MGKLNNSITYLIGAMDRVPDGGTGWRNSIKPLLHNMGVMVIDPCDKPIDIGLEDSLLRKQMEIWKQNGEYDLVRQHMKVIRHVDLRACDLSHFLIVNLDIETHPCGTLEEVFWSNRMKKPIIVHCEQGKRNIPNWLFGTLPHEMFFDTWGQVFDYLKIVNEGKVDNDGRWLFFDFERMKG